MYFVCIILYGLIYIIAKRISLLIEVPHLIIIILMPLYWVFIFVYLHRKGALEKCGICLLQYNKISEYVAYVPLLLMPLTNLVIATLSFCVIKENSVVPLEALLMVYYSLGEEVLFRGAILSSFTKQYKKNVLKGTIITSFMFSGLHMINIYSNATVRYAVIQSLCAGTMGFCFGIITCREKSIIPCVIIHSLTNITSLVICNHSVITGKTERFDLSRFEMMIYLLVAAIYLLYGICLYLKISQKNTKEREHESVY